MTPRAIELRDIRVVRGGRTALDVPALTIESGELIAVVGPNGSGKSTLLQAINGLLPPARGELIVLGDRLTARTALSIRRRCALVFQDPLLLHETVYDNVALAPRFRRDSRERVDQQVRRALRAFRCEHLASRSARRLSGGEIQRVCLARALVCDPELVMLDEPFTALDSQTRSALVRELRDLALKRATTVVLVTHDFEDVLSFSDRAIVLRDGKLVQDASPEQVLRKPVDEVVARLVSMDNILPCQTELEEGGTRVRLANGTVFRIPGRAPTGKGYCCVAGDAMSLAAEKVGPDGTAMQGRIVHVVPGLGLHRVTVDCDGVLVMARIARDRARSVEVGQTVDIAFDASSVHLV